MIHVANPVLEAPEKEQVAAVLDSGMIADGDEVRTFEDEFAAYAGTEHGVATSNGTTALHTALEAVGVEPGEKVVTTPFSFIATANAVRHAGGVPVFADIDPDSYNLDPDAVEAALREHGEDVAAILAVHLYGRPAPMGRLSELADEYGVALVEDAAQAHGATLDGDRIGSLGDVATFSFYPTKNMTTGEGGMITTDDDEIARNARRLVNHGRDTSGYEHVEVGYNFRMTNIAAAIGRAQLDRLPDYVAARREHAEVLNRLLENTHVQTPSDPEDGRHAYHQYTVRSEKRDALKAYLDDNGVQSAVYYPTCIHNQPAYEEFDADAPNAEAAADQVLSLPVHPELTADDIETIGETVRRFEVDHD
ncbi:DegT/DnrJ/EryC1/StrS family aminotransferase [Halobacteriaceae archaeon GCM10025711]